MGKQLQNKANLVFGPRPITTVPVVGDSEVRTKTAIGAMAQFTERQSSAIKETEILKGRLREFEGSLPTKKINPQLIERSKWANRHALSFLDADFGALKADIESQGGNVQPIKIRPLKNKIERFEIVFGHRRHQACLELQLPVLAIIEDLDEKHLFIEMDRENRQRKDLRPYEVGCMYAKALDEGLFSSARRLADEVAIDQSQLTKALALARLPQEVLDAFKSPLDLQYRWASELTAELQKNSDQVLLVAKEIQTRTPRLSSGDVFKILTATRGTVPQVASETVHLSGKSGQKGSLVLNPLDRTIEIKLTNIDASRHEALKVVMQQFLTE